MKNFYYAVIEHKDGKYFAYVNKQYESNNLVNMFEKLQKAGAVVIHPCHTKTKAEELTEEWNRQYKANGIYLFD
jgi:aspartate/tyrosine/aromatic aminotransferase